MTAMAWLKVSNELCNSIDFHISSIQYLGNYTGQHPMAGSSIPVSMPTNLMTKFNRFVYGGSFQLNQPFDGIDVLPPARVIDLSINNAYNQSVIELKWTASTDNYGLSTTLGNRLSSYYSI